MTPKMIKNHFGVIKNLVESEKSCNFASGESCTTSSLRIPQILTEARVVS